jgi:hypothetical protein
MSKTGDLKNGGISFPLDKLERVSCNGRAMVAAKIAVFISVQTSPHSYC